MEEGAALTRPRSIAAYHLLLAILRREELPDVSAAVWQLVPDLAMSHGMVGLLQAHPGFLRAPDDVVLEVQHRTKGLAARALLQRRDLILVKAHLDAAHVPWLLLKGSALSRGLYNPVELRQSGDLDLLVEAKYIRRSLSALAAAGVAFPGSVVASPQHGRGPRGALDLCLEDGTPVDLHWHLLAEPRLRVQMPWDMPSLHDRSIAVDVDGVRVRTLCRSDALHHVAVHAGLAGGRRLSWSHDVRMLATGDINWQAIVAAARATNTSALVAASFDRAARRCRAEIPVDVMDALWAQAPAWRRLQHCMDWLGPGSHADGRWQGRRLTSAGRHSDFNSLKAFITSLWRPSTLASPHTTKLDTWLTQVENWGERPA